MTDISSQAPYEAPLYREPTLGDVVLDFWAAKFWILAGILFGAAVAMLFLSVSIPHYRGTMIVAPAGTGHEAALSSVSSDLIDKGGSPDLKGQSRSDFIRFETLLRGKTIAAGLLEDPSVLEGLKMARRFRVGPYHAPQTPAELVAWLEKNINIEPVRDTPLKEIAVLHPSPEFASSLLERLYELADSHLRKEQLARTEHRIDWLKETLSVTGAPEQRKVLATLLMDQEQKLIVLSIDESYAALVTEPASVSSVPRWPRRGLVIGACLLAGLFLGYALYSLRRAACLQKDGCGI